MSVLIGLILLGGVAAVFMYAVNQRKRWTENVVAVAGDFGLTVEPGGFMNKTAASGRVDGLKLSIDTYTVSHGKSSTTYSRVLVDLDLHPDLHMREESMGSLFSKFFSGDDVELNIEAFDDFAYLEGPESLILAAMTHDARVVLRDAIAAGLTVQEGQVSIRKEGLIQDREKLLIMVKNALTLGRALTENTSSTRLGLVHNALNDPDLRFRIRCFQQLAKKFSVSDETRQAARQFLESDEPLQQIHGAIYLGMEEADTLIEICQNGALSGEIRSTALRALHQVLVESKRVDETMVGLVSGEQQLPDELSELVLKLAGERKVGLPYDSMPFLSQGGSKHALESLAPEHLISLAGALEFCDDERVEASLLNLLEHDEDSVAAAAARALATVAKVNVVPALVERSNGFFRSSELKDSARAAIGQIQGRVGRHMGQSISFSEDYQGDGLSIPEGEA